jgi:hypothetical protein
MTLVWPEVVCLIVSNRICHGSNHAPLLLHTNCIAKIQKDPMRKELNTCWMDGEELSGCVRKELNTC